MNIEKLAELLSKRSHFPQRMIMSILSEPGDTVGDILSMGQPVTISPKRDNACHAPGGQRAEGGGGISWGIAP